MTSFKRTFVNEFSETKRLNNATEAVKGIYSAIRLNEVRFVASALVYSRF